MTETKRDAAADLADLERREHLGALATMAKEALPYWINRAQVLERLLETANMRTDVLMGRVEELECLLEESHELSLGVQRELQGQRDQAQGEVARLKKENDRLAKAWHAKHERMALSEKAAKRSFEIAQRVAQERDQARQEAEGHKKSLAGCLERNLKLAEICGETERETGRLREKVSSLEERLREAGASWDFHA